MSAIALHELEDLETQGPEHLPTFGAGQVRERTPRRRGHLRVVTPGEAVRGEAADVPGIGARVPTERLTLTRRGRLAITLAVATVLVLAVVAALGMLPATASAGHTITVQPGDTLSQIAVTELPELPVDQAIVRIQVANELNTLHVQAGTELEIPAP